MPRPQGSVGFTLSLAKVRSIIDQVPQRADLGLTTSEALTLDHRVISPCRYPDLLKQKQAGSEGGDVSIGGLLVMSPLLQAERQSKGWLLALRSLLHCPARESKILPLGYQHCVLKDC